MTVALVQTATPGIGATSPTCTFASAPTSGNKIIIATTTQQGADPDAPTPPSGFTLSFEVNDSSRKFCVWHKQAGGSEGTSYAPSANGGANQTFGWEVSGLLDTDDVATLVDNGTFGRTTGSVATSLLGPLPSVPVAGLFLVAGLSPGNTVSAPAFSNSFTGLIQHDDRGFVAHRIDTTATSTTPETTATWTTSRFSAGALVAFRATASTTAGWNRVTSGGLAPGAWHRVGGSGLVAGSFVTEA